MSNEHYKTAWVTDGDVYKKASIEWFSEKLGFNSKQIMILSLVMNSDKWNREIPEHFLGLQVDPFLFNALYVAMFDAPDFTIVKKSMRWGTGQSSLERDIEGIKSAAEYKVAFNSRLFGKGNEPAYLVYMNKRHKDIISVCDKELSK